MKIYIVLIFVMFSLSQLALANFKCSDHQYTLSLNDRGAGLPPKIIVTPSIVRGGGTTVNTYIFRRVYPHWNDPSKNSIDYAQADSFTGFISIEGKGLQRVQLTCSDTAARSRNGHDYVPVSNTVQFESKKGDFKNSLNEGDLIEQYPTTGGRVLYRYKNGKLTSLNIELSGSELNQFYYDNLDKFKRASSQVITPMLSSALPTKKTAPPSQREKVQTKTSNTCLPAIKNQIDAKYATTSRILDILYKQKKAELGCPGI